LPFRALPWLVIVPGALLALLGLASLRAGGRPGWQPPLRRPRAEHGPPVVGEQEHSPVEAGVRTSAAPADQPTFHVSPRHP
jgi:hypothetical protein